jgi:hypothetical protein
MFQGVSSMCSCCESTLLWCSHSLPLLSLSLLPSSPQFSIAFNTHLYILYLHRCCILWYYWCSVIPFSFPSFPEFHRVFPLLQTCSTYEFIYDHVCFCVYVYLLDLSSTYKTKKIVLCLSDPGLIQLLKGRFYSCKLLSQHCFHCIP